MKLLQRENIPPSGKPSFKKGLRAYAAAATFVLPGLLLVAMSGAGAFLEIWVSPLLSGLF